MCIYIKICEYVKSFFSILVPVALKAASISTSVTYSLSKGHDVVMLHCNPIMEGIRDPSTIMVDVKWWVLEDNEDKTSTKSSDDESNKSRKKIVFEESFKLGSKTFSTLNRQYWKVGHTVSFIDSNKSVHNPYTIHAH